MRDYRGKCAGDWVYGDLVSRKDGLPPYIHFYDSNGCECMCDIEIKTLGEFTGEKDINHQKIYTCDIVRRTSGLIGDDYDGFVGIVKFIGAAYIIESFDGKDGVSLWSDVVELEKIGDILTTPDITRKNSNWDNHYIDRFERMV